jgi:hypothetical protein
MRKSGNHLSDRTEAYSSSGGAAEGEEAETTTTEEVVSKTHKALRRHTRGETGKYISSQ